ncbi:MAG: 30S ribosomal protein S17 [Actinomycetota bacterium]
MTEAAQRGERKTRVGVVVSDRMERTVVVRVADSLRHPMYGKTVRRTSKLSADNPNDDAKTGDRVRVMETRPVSKTKRWRVVEIVERAK